MFCLFSTAWDMVTALSAYQPTKATLPHVGWDVHMATARLLEKILQKSRKEQQLKTCSEDPNAVVSFDENGGLQMRLRLSGAGGG